MKELFQCEKCGELYDHAFEAVDCETQTDDIIVQVGDIVRTGSFGWFDGDRRWIANPEVVVDWHTDGVCTDKQVNHKPCPNGDSNCFSSCCCMEFYYVVTAIDERCENGRHRTQYHLFTKAMSGKHGYRSGYTYNEGHIRPEKIPTNPPPLDVDDLIGQKAECLL